MKLSLKPGSSAWLIANELRLSWRQMTLPRKKTGLEKPRRFPPWMGLALMGVGYLAWAIFCVWIFGYEVGSEVSPLKPKDVRGAVVLFTDLGLVGAFTLMMSVTIALTAQSFVERSDLDLLLTSPIPPERILTARCFGIFLSAAQFLLLAITPALIGMAIYSSPQWLSLLLMVLNLAALAQIVGLWLAVVIFRTLGPRRGKTFAQVLAAITGAIFFLVLQLRNLLSQDQRVELFSLFKGLSKSPELSANSILAIPAHLAFGTTWVTWVLPFLCFGALFYAFKVYGASFAKMTADLAASDAGQTRKDAAERAFKGGALRQMVFKEWRLIQRDVASLSQILLRVLYLLPVTFLLVNSSLESGNGFQLKGMVAGVVAMFASQIAGTLAWVMIQGESHPDLLNLSPYSAKRLRWAKLLAAVLPTLVLSFFPLLMLGVSLGSLSGLGAFLGVFSAIMANVLVVLWRGHPVERAMIIRGRYASRDFWTMLLTFVLISLFALSAGLLASGMVIGFAPMVVGWVFLGALQRPTDAPFGAPL